MRTGSRMVAGLAGLAVAAGATAAGVATAQSGGAAQELTLSAIADRLDYDTDRLSARPGPIRIVMSNPSVQAHNISLSGPGLDPARIGPVVGQGQTSTIEVDLPAGDYTFFCVVGAHAQLGMSGTLVVAEAGADPGTPPPPAPGPALTPPPRGTAADVTLSVAQLRINQRISQAAIRRLNRLDALLDGRPAPEPATGAGGAGEVTLSAGQLRINQRISQAAVRRANALEARLEGREPPAAPAPGGGGEIRLSAGQLLINQRISQAAVRRANALEPRVEAAVAARGAGASATQAS